MLLWIVHSSINVSVQASPQKEPAIALLMLKRSERAQRMVSSHEAWRPSIRALGAREFRRQCMCQPFLRACASACLWSKRRKAQMACERGFPSLTFRNAV